MARKDRVSMERQAQILVLYRRGYSVRRIAKVLKMCRRSIRKYIDRHSVEEKKPLQAEVFPEQKKEEMQVIAQLPEWVRELDWRCILQDIRKGITYKILYQEAQLQDVGYWTFWNTFSRLNKKLNPDAPKTTMRLVHKPGEKAFVDYGDGIEIIDPTTGYVQKTWIFVGTLPFSSKVYAEFVFEQKLPAFISAHERMWKYFGGVTQYTVSDNLKSAVNRAHLYDPDVNKMFCSYANHAGFALLPARPYKPKDKANVECHVGLFQRSFFQEVRHRIFHTIGELNIELRSFLYKFNNNIMKEYGVSRNERFSEEEKFLQPLPFNDFLIPDVREATVHPDCHIQVGKAFYSVPWQYVGKKVRVISTTERVEVFDILSLDRVALHSPARKHGERKTDPLHWPPGKLEHTDFTIERAKKDAKNIGIKTSELIHFLFSKPHPLQFLRRIQGWLRRVSQSKCTREAMEYAATMALQHSRFQSEYINSCTVFFDRGGLNQSTKTGAPKRNSNHIYIHE